MINLRMQRTPQSSHSTWVGEPRGSDYESQLPRKERDFPGEMERIAMRRPRSRCSLLAEYLVQADAGTRLLSKGNRPYNREEPGDV
jgi:hypothetical protein